MSSTNPQKIDEFEPLLLALQNALGVVVPDGKRMQLTLSLTPLLARYQLNSLTDLADRLSEKNSDELKSSVLEAITRCDTTWSLTDEIRTVLHKYILAQLKNDARIWVIGCGQGQLAYTVAMEIANHERISAEAKNIRIIASDIPPTDIAIAEAAVYSDSEISGLSDEYRRLYFTQKDTENWQIKDKIRQQVSFEPVELTTDFQSLCHMDLIICPDVLVYFSNGVKAGVLSQFSSLLKPGGILLTGYSQIHAPTAAGFERVDHPSGIFYRQKS